jgi:hypothetical protein
MFIYTFIHIVAVFHTHTHEHSTKESTSEEKKKKKRKNKEEYKCYISRQFFFLYRNKKNKE